MYARTLRKAHDIRRFTIHQAGPTGWEIRDEQNDAVLRHVRYTDWHRVERAQRAFQCEAATLHAAGWTDD